MFSVSCLEEAVDNGDNPRIRQLARESWKWGMQAIKASKKFKRDRVEVLRLLGTYSWLIGKHKKALKWWAASIETGERLKMRLDLPRTYFEIGKRLSEPQSPIRNSTASVQRNISIKPRQCSRKWPSNGIWSNWSM